MGATIERSCPKCAYRRELAEGVGLNGRNKNMIRTLFSEEELKPFEEAVEKEILERYEVRQEVGFCENCHDIESVAVLVFTVSGEKEKIIRKSCPKCQGALSFQGKENVCPRCGTKLKVKEIGMWD